MVKTLKRVLFAALACVIAACCLSACTDREQKLTGTMTLVVEGQPPVEYGVELKNVKITQGVMSILEYLKKTLALEYTASDGFLTKVGSLSPEGNSYICIYTSVKKDFDVSGSEYVTTIEFNGQTLTSSGVGASDMTIETGCIIYFGIATY
jgi:hypothetical protein